MPTPKPMTPQEQEVANVLDKLGIEYEFAQRNSPQHHDFQFLHPDGTITYVDAPGVHFMNAKTNNPTPIEPLTTVLEHLVDIVDTEQEDGTVIYTDDARYWITQARQYTTPAPELRTVLVHLKLSAVEKLELERRAREAGQTMSDYARMRIFGNG